MISRIGIKVIIIHMSHKNLVIEESHRYDFKPREHHGHENVII